MSNARKPLYRRLVDLSLGGSRSTAEMDEELESHVAMRVADLVQAGMSETDARADARRRFGDFAEARRRLHDGARRRDAAVQQRDRWGAFIADVRYAMRQTRRAPGYAALAILTLAIGLGAATAMFTLVDHILIRPLPFPHADRLYTLVTSDSVHTPIETASKADLIDYRTAASVDLAAMSNLPFHQAVTTNDSAGVVNAVRASGNFFFIRP